MNDQMKKGGVGRLLRPLAVLLVGLVIGSATVLVSEGVASAASYQIANTGGDRVKIRDNPTGASTFSGYASPGVWFDVVCQQWGEAQGPNGNTLWLKVNGAGRNGWWLNDSWTSSPHMAADKTVGIPGVPRCGATPPPLPPPTGSAITTNSPLYLCVNTGNAGCRPSGMPSASTGQAVTMKCWKKGSWVGGTDMWFWVTGTFGEGYVTANVVTRQTQVGACDSIKGFVAAEAALTRSGQVWASAADSAAFTTKEWSPGPVGEWAGDCPKLPYLGWRAAGVTIPKNNAINNYNAVKNSIKQGTPPRGAVVFWNIAAPYGHEAISVGNGYVVTTRGLDGSKAANEVVKYSYFGSYLGWWMPA